MGLQIRKRKSTGKNTWLNYSKSGVSHSSRCGKVTTNVSARGIRYTVNLGNGVRYVTGGTWGKRSGGFNGFLLRLGNGMMGCAILWFLATLIRDYIL